MAGGQTAQMRLMPEGEPQNVKTRKRTLNQTKHLYNNRTENRACATKQPQGRKYRHHGGPDITH